MSAIHTHIIKANEADDNISHGLDCIRNGITPCSCSVAQQIWQSLEIGRQPIAGTLGNNSVPFIDISVKFLSKRQSQD